jgi:hypothetical protein
MILTLGGMAEKGKPSLGKLLKLHRCSTIRISDTSKPVLHGCPLEGIGQPSGFAKQMA